MTSTHDRLRTMLVDAYRVDPDAVSPDATLESLGIDSIGAAELLFNVEEEWGVSMPHDATPPSTVGDVVRMIDALVATRAASPGTPPPAVAA